MKSLIKLLAGAAALAAITACSNSAQQPIAVTGTANNCPANLNPASPVLWNGHGGDLLAQNRYQAKAGGLSKANIGQLQLAWSYSHPWTLGSRSSLAVTDEAVIVGDTGGNVVALDRRTGCVRWKKEEGQNGQPGPEVASGFTFGAFSADGAGRAVYYTTDNGYLVKRNYVNGALHWRRRYEDHPAVSSRSSVALHNGVVYLGHSNNEINSAFDANYPCCTSRGAIVAMNAYTGDLIWKRYTIDQTPGFQYAGDKVQGPSGANVWGVPFIDAARNQLLVGTGQQYSGPGVNASDAIIAFDLTTGAKRWTFQALANDIINLGCTDIFTWGFTGNKNCDPDYIPNNRAGIENKDLDVNSTPIIATRSSGAPIVLGASKGGEVFGLDANSGALIWRTRIGAGGTYGGVHWGFVVDDERNRMFVGVSDKTGPKTERVFDYLSGAGAGELNDAPNAKPGMYALNIDTGQMIWSNQSQFWSPRDNQYYKPVISANPVMISGVVLAGTLSGHLMAFDADNGSVLWTRDTVFDRMGTNGVAGNGGAIDGNWPIVAGGMVFTDSGYRAGAGGQGNMLQAYRLP